MSFNGCSAFSTPCKDFSSSCFTLHKTKKQERNGLEFLDFRGLEKMSIRKKCIKSSERECNIEVSECHEIFHCYFVLLNK